MKILHVCKYFYPRITGVTTHVGNLVRQQRLAGHKVAVATWGQEPADAADGESTVLRASPRDAPGLVGMMRQYGPDLIHAHSIWETTDLAVAAARAIGCPYVVTTHGTWHFLGYTGAMDRLWDRWRLGIWRRRMVWPRILRGAGTVVALNALEEAEGLRAGVEPGRLRRIPNAVDPGEFVPGDAAIARRALGWPEAFTVLFVGAVQAQKGIFTLLEAVAALEPAKRPRLVVCGEGPDLEAARDMTASRRLGATTAFLGRVGRVHMPELYRAADVMALPSRQEPFATALLEAMACAKPCLGCDDGGTPEIIDHGRTGRLVAPGNSRALAEALAAFGDDPESARDMGRAGRRKVEERFAWPLVAGRIEAAYKTALAAFCLLLMLLACRPALAGRAAALPLLALEPLDMAWTAAPVGDVESIHLTLARGETTGFQMVLWPEAGERPDDVSLVVDAPGGLDVRVYRLWDIWGVPEVAVPMDQGRPKPFPKLGEAAGQGNDRPWRAVVEVSAPPQVGPGVRSGRVSLRWPGGSREYTLELTVLPFALPRRPTMLVEMNSYGDCLRLLPSAPETLRDLHRLFRHFRTTFTLVPYRQDGALLLDCLAPALGDAAVDFTAFDAAWSGLFDGSAFTDGVPLSHWILPLHVGWPAALGTPEAPGRNAAVRRSLAAHLREKGWRETRFQEFHNENPEHGSPSAWRLDEPASRRDLEGHALFLGYRRAACREEVDGGCPLAYRMDISRWRPLAPEIQMMLAEVTDWSVSADPAFLDKDAVGFFREMGASWLVAYGELPGFVAEGRPTPRVAFPARLAALWLLGVDGFAQWQVDRWQDKAIDGVPREAVPLVYSNASGARDWIWPGQAFGVAEAVPSARLFALREGLNILDYLALARAVQPAASVGLESRLGALRPGTPEAWAALKATLADTIRGSGRQDG